ncbi:MAG TPA: ClpXP protease specificity-enhancing factor SspB [Xanthobacteraceae bacterium]|nr:ClpXP protease specificity-enhancing factor SspB [Xanthobacteraceae bacterium]
MPDLIRYDLLAQDALRGVVKKVLTDVAKNGLPGEHHFFVAFDTRADGVKMSDWLREKHPEEMTVVLQHQFWDLIVGDKQFEVGLSFKGVPERLVVPFEAIKGFFDPSVQFGLQFETITEAQAIPTEAANESEAGKAAEAGSGERQASRPTPRGAASEPDERPALPRSRKKAEPATAETPPAEKSKKSADKQAGAEVVSLDKFRKK